MNREFRVVPITKWAIVEHCSDGNTGSMQTLAELSDGARADELAQRLADAYGGVVTTPAPR